MCREQSEGTECTGYTALFARGAAADASNMQPSIFETSNYLICEHPIEVIEDCEDNISLADFGVVLYVTTIRKEASSKPAKSPIPPSISFMLRTYQFSCSMAMGRRVSCLAVSCGCWSN